MACFVVIKPFGLLKSSILAMLENNLKVDAFAEESSLKLLSKSVNVLYAVFI